MSDRPSVLLIVSGGIAAYKAPALVRALIKRGHEVQVIATPAALSFTTELALSTVSGRPVRTSLLDPAQEGTVGHIELADWPDLVVVAPATADLMAKAAHGLAGDLASTVLLATRSSVLWAPAMNTNMWSHAATVANVATLAGRGASFVGPDAGELACGWVGEGRMIEPDTIADRADEMLRGASSWTGKRVLVSAGPTRAYLDPVRFFSNASTGAMGFAIAEVAARRGADVVLVSGPVQRQTPAGVRRVSVETAEQMLQAMDAELTDGGIDLVAMVAAVSDLVSSQPSSKKLPKDDMTKALAAGVLVEGIDVLATLTARHAERTYFLGFGAQTVEDGADGADDAALRAALVRAGRSKLVKKGAHSIFVNRVGVPGVGFGSETNTGVLLRSGHDEVRDAGPARPKVELAAWLLDELATEVLGG